MCNEDMLKYHVWHFTHILEKPLCCSQAFTSAGVEDMSRGTEGRVSRCVWKEKGVIGQIYELCCPAEPPITQLTGASSMGRPLFIGSKTFWGTFPSSLRLFRTSHHRLDCWITCFEKWNINIWWTRLIKHIWMDKSNFQQKSRLTFHIRHLNRDSFPFFL